MAVAIGVIVVVAFFVLIFLGSAVRVLREYERGVIFRLGRLIAQKGPGLILLVPIIDRMVRVSLRMEPLPVSAMKASRKSRQKPRPRTSPWSSFAARSVTRA